MRKILVSVLGISFALFLTGRLVYSSFSAQAVNNNFSTAHPKLLISDDGKKFKPNIQGFREKNVYPGYKNSQLIWFQYTGFGDLEIYPVVEIKGGNGKANKDNSLISSITLQFFKGNDLIPQKSLPLTVWLDNAATKAIKLDTLGNGVSGPWEVVLVISSEAGNEIQKEKIHFDLKFVGVEKGGEKKK